MDIRRLLKMEKALIHNVGKRYIIIAPWRRDENGKWETNEKGEVKNVASDMKGELSKVPEEQYWEKYYRESDKVVKISK